MTTATDSIIHDLDRRIDALLPTLVATRHDIHRHPELGFEEVRTQEVVHRWLEQLGYHPRVSAETGLIADVRPDFGSEAIALRADLDCLPMHETTDLPYRSVHDGRAHKCGHDGHTAILMGVAKLLADVRESLPCNVRLLFQPAEEGVRGGGAKVMVAEGALHGVREIYGLHNWPGYPHGQIHVTPGVTMAATAEFDVHVAGVGGHGSQPQLCRDPVVAAAGMISAMQTIVSRGVSSHGGVVVSVCRIHGGHAHNVIPQEVRFGGTIRTFTQQLHAQVLERLDETIRGAATSFGVCAALEIREGYPVLENNPKCASVVAQVAKRLVGEANVRSDTLPMAGGEDFAYFAQAVPAAYFFVGSGNAELTSPVCHHPDFDFDDSIIPLAMRMFVGIVHNRAQSSRPSASAHRHAEIG